MPRNTIIARLAGIVVTSRRLVQLIFMEAIPLGVIISPAVVVTASRRFFLTIAAVTNKTINVNISHVNNSINNSRASYNFNLSVVLTLPLSQIVVLTLLEQLPDLAVHHLLCRG
jgi:uncharacterized protein (DUF111 family)